MLKKFVLLTAFLTCTLPAFGDVACTSGNLSNLIGTTCDIGSFQFTFTAWTAVSMDSDIPYFLLHPSTSSPGAPAASNFIFTALSDGFTLSGSSPVVIGPHRQDFGFLSYTIVDLDGQVAENVTATGFFVAGHNASVAQAFGDNFGTSPVSLPSAELLANQGLFQFNGGVRRNLGDSVLGRIWLCLSIRLVVLHNLRQCGLEWLLNVYLYIRP